jgi:hypothetical protein
MNPTVNAGEEVIPVVFQGIIAIFMDICMTRLETDKHNSSSLALKEIFDR